MIKPDLSTRPKPQRLRIMLALKELLEQISTADGDAFDLFGKVYTGRTLLGADVTEDDGVPCLAIIEAPRPDFATFAGEENIMRRDNWTLLIQGLAPNDRSANTADYAYFLCQDVERRLQRIMATKGSSSPMYPDIYKLGDKITSVEIAPPVVRPPEAEVSRHSFFYLPVRFGVGLQVGE